MTPITARTFFVDVTPPLGNYLCGGLHGTPAIGVEQPISLRGMIFEQGGKKYVVAAVEYCYLCGKSHDRMIAAMAHAAGVDASAVTLHSVHTHDAPLIYEEVHTLFSQPAAVHDEVYFQSVIDGTRRAIQSALATPGTVVSGVRFSHHRVEQFASTRRILDANNRCKIRFSRCPDPVLKAAPEGKIDPLVDQVIFYNPANKPFACLHFYASHPQVSDGRRLISGDTVGVALDLFTQTNPGVFSVYFTGCAGDITAGKYTTAHRERDRVAFGVRLFDGMQAAFEKSTPPTPVTKLDWCDGTFDMPLSSESKDAAHYRAILDNPQIGTGGKYMAGLKYHKLTRGFKSYPFRTSCLKFDDLHVLFMPSELSVEYQLFAKSLRPGKVAVAAYGDSFLNYIATDEAFDQGGYEVDPAWTEVSRGCETPIKDSIRAALK